MSMPRREIFSPTRRRKGLSIILEEPQTTQPTANRFAEACEKSLPMRRSLSLSRRPQSSKSASPKEAPSAYPYIIQENGGHVTQSDLEIPVHLRSSFAIQPTSSPEPTGAEPKLSSSSKWKRKLVGHGLRRAFSLNARSKPKVETLVQEKEGLEVTTVSKVPTTVTAVQVDYGASFNLSAIFDSAETRDFADFLQPMTASDTVEDRTSRRRTNTKRMSTASNSIIDLSGADWDAMSFYTGDLASKDVYKEEQTAPSSVGAREHSLVGFFGNYMGKQARRRLAENRKARKDQKSGQDTLIQSSPNISPSLCTRYAPSEVCSNLSNGFTAEKTSSMGSTTPSNNNHTENYVTTSETSSSGDILEDTGPTWIGSFLGYDRASSKLDIAHETPRGGYPRERHDCGEIGQEQRSMHWA